MNISVCMATYNGERYIEKQITSILKQLSADDEIVIVDDCSNDNTIKVIKKFGDKRIRVEINKVNMGFIASFEKAILKAKNEVIFLSDQDDQWFPNKIDRVMQTFEDMGAILVIHNARVVDGNDELIKLQWYNNGLGKNLFTRHFINNHNMGCMMAFKKELCPLLGEFPKILESHDQWIGLIADIYQKKVYFLDENLLNWVRHGDNTSSMVRRTWGKILLSRMKMAILIFIAYKRKYLR